MRARAASGRALAALALLALVVPARGSAQASGGKTTAHGEGLPWPPVATFSVLGYDPETGEVGVAVQSRVFSVGNGVIWGKADVGVAATQAIVDVSYGPRALELLEEGLTPEQVVAAHPGRGPRSASRGLAGGRPPVFRDGRPRQRRHAHRPSGVRVGGAPHRRARLRAGQHPGGARGRGRNGGGLRLHRGPPVLQAAGRARSGAEGRR